MRLRSAGIPLRERGSHSGLPERSSLKMGYRAAGGRGQEASVRRPRLDGISPAGHKSAGKLAADGPRLGVNSKGKGL